MGKKAVLSLINALKTLKDIIIKHNETFTNYLDIRSMSTMNRFLYQQERFDKITKDINSLMKRVVNKEDFESYLENSNRILRDLATREDSINKQVKNGIQDFQLYLKDLKDKMLEFDKNLSDIVEKLK